MRWILRAAILAACLGGIAFFHHLRTSRPTRVEAANRAGILLLGNGTEPATLDPQLASGQPEHMIFHALFEGLISPAPGNPDGDAPGAAVSWTQENFTVWTFKLQPQGKWSDGAPLTAADFVYSYQRILTAKLGADYAGMLYPILNAEEYHTGKITDFSQVGVKALDPLTLQITLKGPAPYLPSMIKHYAWFPMPKQAIEKFGSMTDRNTRWTRPGNMVCNGAFKLKRWDVNQALEVERNPHYWDAATVKLNGIVFLPISNDTTEERAFADGQLHVTLTMPLSKIPAYEKGKSPSYHNDPLLSVYMYRLNTTRKPFDNPLVRRALALAIDRESITRNILRAGQKPATGLTPPGCNASYQVPDIMRFDPAEARKLLAEAGFPDGQGFPPFDILINTSPAHRALAEAVQAMWKEHLKIPAGVLNQDWGVYIESQRKLDYQVARYAWVGDYLDPSTFLGCWQTGDGNNNTGWGSKRYDELIHQSFQEGDVARRLHYLNEAETLLLNEAPIIPIYWYTHSYLMRPEVKGMLPSLLEHRCYKAVELRP
ncbi:peptide ABC transporter substrate-binding protein [Prosthecobacter sp.]|uniref:peptide ABC transporter substrate-binding protein n=1 Tax=Prosthecobacter sp. TaxID=1965333 RepID=UPI003784FCA4